MGFEAQRSCSSGSRECRRDVGCPGSRPSLVGQMAAASVQPGARKGRYSSCIWRTSNRLVYPDSPRGCDCRPEHRIQWVTTYGGSSGSIVICVERGRETILLVMMSRCAGGCGSFQAHSAWLEAAQVPQHRPLGSCHPLLAATGVQEREFERMAGLLSCQDLSTPTHAFCCTCI